MPHPSVPGWISIYAEIIWPLLITGWFLADVATFGKWAWGKYLNYKKIKSEQKYIKANKEFWYKL